MPTHNLNPKYAQNIQLEFTLPNKHDPFLTFQNISIQLNLICEAYGFKTRDLLVLNFFNRMRAKHHTTRYVYVAVFFNQHYPISHFSCFRLHDSQMTRIYSCRVYIIRDLNTYLVQLRNAFVTKYNFEAAQRIENLLIPTYLPFTGAFQ